MVENTIRKVVEGDTRKGSGVINGNPAPAQPISKDPTPAPESTTSKPK